MTGSQFLKVILAISLSPRPGILCSLVTENNIAWWLRAWALGANPQIPAYYPSALDIWKRHGISVCFEVSMRIVRYDAWKVFKTGSDI